MFLDEDQSEEELLPDLFDPEVVQMLKSDICMSCAVKFNLLTLKHHCRKCGKQVCDACSKNKRRLSRLEKTKYKVCDECDTLMSNYNFTRMHLREIEQKRNTHEELMTRI